MTVERPDNSPQQKSPGLLAPLRFLYGIYAIVLFLALGLCTLLLVLVVPGMRRRRRIARAMSRAFFSLAGMPLTVKGAEQLPDGQCVVVSNHASYLDGVVFTAALPAQFSFVIKREMNGVPLAGLLLRRLGSHFVERFNRNRGAADARRVLRDAISGNSLAFFPEGTFHAQARATEVSYGSIHHSDSRGMPHSAGDRPGHARGAIADRWPSPPGADRGTDSPADRAGCGDGRGRGDRTSRPRTGCDPS